MKVTTKQDALKQFEILTEEVLPDIIRKTAATIRVGSIINVNSDSRQVDVRLTPTNDVLIGLKYSKGITDVVVGDICLITSSDPALKAQNFVVGIF